MIYIPDHEGAEVLTEPLNASQIRERLDELNFVSGVVSVNLSDAIDGDLESWLDLLGRALVGHDTLMEINYKVVGLGDTEDELLVLVTGDPRLVLELEEEEEGGQDEQSPVAPTDHDPPAPDAA